MLRYEVVHGIEPSYAERAIATALNEKSIPFAQEVVFDGCFNPETGKSLRFDFYLPHINTLLEYDGKDFHQDATVRRRDRIKSTFAKDNGIRLIRIQGLSNIEKFFSDALDIRLEKGIKWAGKERKPKYKPKVIRQATPCKEAQELLAIRETSQKQYKKLLDALKKKNISMWRIVKKDIQSVFTQRSMEKQAATDPNFCKKKGYKVEE